MTDIRSLPKEILDKILSFSTPQSKLAFSEATGYPSFTGWFEKCPICVIGLWFDLSGQFCDTDLSINLALMFKPVKIKYDVKFEGQKHKVVMYEPRGGCPSEYEKFASHLAWFDKKVKDLKHSENPEHYLTHAKTGLIPENLREYIIQKRVQDLKQNFLKRNEPIGEQLLDWHEIYDYRKQAEYEVFQELTVPFREALFEILKLKSELNLPEKKRNETLNFPAIICSVPGDTAEKSGDIILSPDTSASFHAVAYFQKLLPGIDIGQFSKGLAAQFLFRRMIKLVSNSPDLKPCYFAFNLPWGKNPPFQRFALCRCHKECRDIDYIDAFKKHSE